jgi:hypothetical protein
LECDDDSAARLAHAFGAPEGLRIGESFRCPLHDDERASATLWRADERSHVLLHDFHARGRGAWLRLATVRAEQAGRFNVARPEFAIWKLRLAHEAGFLEPANLGPDLPVLDDEIWHGFLYLLGLRWLVSPREPAPFSAGFAASWCGVSRRRAHEGTRELIRGGFLRLSGRDAHGTRLWLPEGVRPID